MQGGFHLIVQRLATIISNVVGCAENVSAELQITLVLRIAENENSTNDEQEEKSYR